MTIFSKKANKNRMATSKRRLFHKSVAASPVLPMPPMPLFATPWRGQAPAAKPFRPSKFARSYSKLPELAPPVPIAGSKSRKSRRHKRDDENKIHTFDELLVALNNHESTITLGDDIIVKHNILIDYDVTINLGGYNVVSERDLPMMRIFDVRHGEFTLTGEGNVFAMGPESVALRVFGAISTGVPDYTVVTVDEQVHLYAPEGTGIYIASNLGAAYGLTIDLAGSITAHGGIYLASGVRGRSSYRPAIYLRSGSSITVDENSGTAIDASGIGDWNIASTKIRGFLGIKAEFGRFTLSNSSIATGSVAILLDTDAGAGLSLTIDGGSFQSTDALTILGKPTGINKFVVKSGDFCSEKGIINRELSKVAVFEGGDFYDNLVDFAAKDQKLTDEEK